MDVDEPVHAGDLEYAQYGGAGGDQLELGSVLCRSPERAHQRANPRRIAECCSAHVRDHHGHTLVHHGKQLFAYLVGVRCVDLRGKPHDGGLTAPLHPVIVENHAAHHPFAFQKGRRAASQDPYYGPARSGGTAATIISADRPGVQTGPVP